MLTTRFHNTSIPNFSNLFDELFNPELVSKNAHSNRPAVNVIEQADQFLIEVAAPGLEKEDFKVELEGQKLIISCQNEEKKNEENLNYRRKEFSFSSFRRTFNITNALDGAKISAKYDQGILTVPVPKKEAEAQSVQTIKIS